MQNYCKLQEYFLNDTFAFMTQQKKNIRKHNKSVVKSVLIKSNSNVVKKKADATLIC